ncbi:hypothetical protein [Halomonas citrativorans]|uniref:Uncharacterized protein n=1 Tax=Halomonas citrativorans TaxID=2742612 RepID=A0ABR9FDD6_9GAMM|nr:hypothetical protein [Halomonas citrativorans]MBE0404478.1 hypothetical protein [Halomonas citrativorans]
MNHGKIDNTNEEKSYTRYSNAYRQEALVLADALALQQQIVNRAYMRASSISWR